jgi:hypothetical protein
MTLPKTRRSSPVIPAYDGAGRPLGLTVRGVPHCPQSFIVGRLVLAPGTLHRRRPPDWGSRADVLHGTSGLSLAGGFPGVKEHGFGCMGSGAVAT